MKHLTGTQALNILVTIVICCLLYFAYYLFYWHFYYKKEKNKKDFFEVLTGVGCFVAVVFGLCLMLLIIYGILDFYFGERKTIVVKTDFLIWSGVALAVVTILLVVVFLFKKKRDDKAALFKKLTTFLVVCEVIALGSTAFFGYHVYDNEQLFKGFTVDVSDNIATLFRGESKENLWKALNHDRTCYFSSLEIMVDKDGTILSIEYSKTFKQRGDHYAWVNMSYEDKTMTFEVNQRRVLTSDIMTEHNILGFDVFLDNIDDMNLDTVMTQVENDTLEYFSFKFTWMDYKDAWCSKRFYDEDGNLSELDKPLNNVQYGLAMTGWYYLSKGGSQYMGTGFIFCQ